MLAASVQPFGGNGTLPVTELRCSAADPGTAPGDGGANTYDKPAGVIVGGTVGTPIAYPNYSEVSYYNEQPTGVAYDPSDPTIDDDILPGSINEGFASTPVSNSKNSKARTPSCRSQRHRRSSAVSSRHPTAITKITPGSSPPIPAESSWARSPRRISWCSRLDRRRQSHHGATLLDEGTWHRPCSEGKTPKKTALCPNIQSAGFP